MFHEDGMQLRFEIKQKRDDTIIRVMPKRGLFAQHRSEGGRDWNWHSREDDSRQGPETPRNAVQDSTGGTGHGAASSSTEAYARASMRPIPKKAPLPPPPSYKAPEPRSSQAGPNPARVIPARVPVKVEEPDFDPEPETDESDQKAPDPPPGEHWEEFEDDGKPWFYYSGPKGHWCCQGPGQPVLPYEMPTME